MHCHRNPRPAAATLTPEQIADDLGGFDPFEGAAA
jgi:hypothetical protein